MIQDESFLHFKLFLCYIYNLFKDQNETSKQQLMFDGYITLSLFICESGVFVFLKVEICCGHVWYRFLIDITCEILSYVYAKFVLLSLGATSSHSHITRSQMQNDFRMILDSQVGLFSCFNITDQLIQSLQSLN